MIEFLYNTNGSKLGVNYIYQDDSAVHVNIILTARDNDRGNTTAETVKANVNNKNTRQLVLSRRSVCM